MIRALIEESVRNDHASSVIIPEKEAGRRRMGRKYIDLSAVLLHFTVRTSCPKAFRGQTWLRPVSRSFFFSRPYTCAAVTRSHPVL